MEVKFLAQQNSESLREALQELSLKTQECIRYVCDVLCRLLVSLKYCGLFFHLIRMVELSQSHNFAGSIYKPLAFPPVALSSLNY